jgi:hypothetical protein
MANQRDNRSRAASGPGAELSRRRLLKAMGAGAVTATVAAAAGNRRTMAAGMEQAANAADTSTRKPAPDVTPLRAWPFPLADVRLLDGPFKDAQQRDGKYLLQLEPDRMLHNFRVNAGLQPKAAVYGGWESVAIWADIRAHGHTLGHYLSACALMYASTGDDAFKKRCDYIVADLQECQSAGKTGLICAFPDKAAQIDNLIAGRRVIGVPWYTLHKIMAGLRDTHVLCGSAAALDVLVKLTDWAFDATKDMSDEQFQKMLGTEHGGMNEVLGDVYALTSQAKYLTLSERFCHKAILEPMSQSRDTLNGLHSNTQIPKIIGFHRLHLLTGQTPYLTAAQFFWKAVVSTRSFATGGNGDQEHFFPITDFARHLPSAKTMETCCSHNMLKLTRALFSLEPSAEYADYYERALYNTILASQDPDSGMMTYFQSTRPGYLKMYCTPFDSFWCCTGTGIENHAKYGDSIYFLGSDGVRNAIYVNLFIPSALTWKQKGLTLKQTTRFPEAGKTRLEFTVDSPTELTLFLRHPAWCAQAAVTVNGNSVATSKKPGTFIALKGTWKSGDVVELEVPMTLHVEMLPGNVDYAAVMYGPLVLVGALGKEGITPGGDIHVNERTIGQDFNQPIEVPEFAGDQAQLVEKIKPAEPPLTFKTTGLGRPNDVTLVPYYRVAHERYNMYWKLSNA